MQVATQNCGCLISEKEEWRGEFGDPMDHVCKCHNAARLVVYVVFQNSEELEKT